MEAGSSGIVGSGVGATGSTGAVVGAVVGSTGATVAAGGVSTQAASSMLITNKTEKIIEMRFIVLPFLQKLVD